MVNKLQEFMGRGLTRALVSNYTLNRGQERVQAFTPDLDGYTVTLPDTAFMRVGGPVFYVVNLSDTYFFNVTSHNAYQTYQVDPEKCLVLSIVSKSANVRWMAQSRDMAGTGIGEVTP